MNVAVARVTETGLPLAYLNQVGGQDELVFDGASFVLNADCSLAVAAARLGGGGRPSRSGARTPAAGAASQAPLARIEEGDAAAYHACVLGLARLRGEERLPRRRARPLGRHRQRARRRAWPSMRWGPTRVHARDAALPLHLERTACATPRRCAEGARRALRHACRSSRRSTGFMQRWRRCFAGRAPDTTEENIQSRARGIILMAISNKFGGDGADHRQQERDVGRLRHALRRHERRLQPDQGPLQDGGLSPGALAQRATCRSGGHGPRRRRHPGAHPHQGADARSCARTRRTRTACRPTTVLDDILRCLVEDEMPLPEIIARGHPPETVKKVERLLYLAEYKRRQAAPGVKISAATSAATAAIRSPTASARISQRHRQKVRRRPNARHSSCNPAPTAGMFRRTIWTAHWHGSLFYQTRTSDHGSPHARAPTLMRLHTSLSELPWQHRLSPANPIFRPDDVLSGTIAKPGACPDTGRIWVEIDGQRGVPALLWRHAGKLSPVASHFPRRGCRSAERQDRRGRNHLEGAELLHPTKLPQSCRPKPSKYRRGHPARLHQPGTPR